MRQSACLLLASFLACFSFFSTPLQTLAGVKDFIPRYVGLLGDFSVGSLYEQDKITSAAGESKRSDLTIQEGLTLKSPGYIYSPLFISMMSSVTLGLRQEQASINGKRYSANGDGSQFKQEFKILPRHHYNAELYFQRSNPMTSGQAGNSGSTVNDQYGVSLHYDKRPWSSSLMYNNNKAKSNTTSEYDMLLYNFNYFQTATNISGSYAHNTRSEENGVDKSTSDLYNLNFNRNFTKARFTSRWNLDKQNDDILALKRESFYSDLNIELPKNFNTGLSYRISDNISSYERNGTEFQTYNETESFLFKLRHRLYRSLNSSFRAGHSTTETRGGDLKQQNYQLSFNYSKQIPWGNVNSGISKGLSFIDNTGAPTILFSPYTFQPDLDTNTCNPTNGRYTISLHYQSQTVDTDSIKVLVKDDNGNLVLLTEGIHYTLDTTNTYIIEITQGVYPANVATTSAYPCGYEFQIDYALLPAEYSLRTDSLAYTLQLPLFDKLITPHYSYNQNEQKLVDGNYPGEPGKSKAHTLGVSLHKSPFSGKISRSWMRSNTTSEDKLSTSLTYNKPITPLTNGTLNLRYEDVYTKQHDNDNPDQDGQSSQHYSAQAQINTSIPNKNLTASLGTSYTLSKGTAESTNISLVSNLIWRVGRMDINLSASHGNQYTEICGQNSTSREHTMVRLVIKRELF